MGKKSLWDEMNEGYKCRGDYAGMSGRLKGFEDLAKHVNRGDVKVTEEAKAMQKSLGVKDSADFWICSYEEYLKRVEKKDEPDYLFGWCWTGNIVWRFPGGYRGGIWIS